MKRTFLLLAFLVLPATASAQTLCSQEVSVGMIGSTVVAQEHWHFGFSDIVIHDESTGGEDFSGVNISSGVDQVTWVAAYNDEVLSVVLDSGNPRGWSCTIDIVSITPPFPRPAQHTFSQGTKDNITTVGQVCGQVGLWFQACVATAAAFGRADWVAYCAVSASVTGVCSKASDVIVKNDPYNPNYYAPASPIYNDPISLGGADCSTVSDGFLNYLCNAMDTLLVQADYTEQGMATSNDLYMSSCADGVCIDARRQEALWWTNRHGDYIQDASNLNRQAADYCAQTNCGDGFSEQSDQLDWAAWQFQGAQ